MADAGLWKFMQFFRLISPARAIFLESSVNNFSVTHKFEGFARFCTEIMDQAQPDAANSTLNGEAVKAKSAKELKKEAQRQAKLEKFKKKQEQQAALKETQNDVSDSIWFIRDYFYMIYFNYKYNIFHVINNIPVLF